MKDDIVQLLTKIFSKIINPFLSKNALSTSAAHLTEKNTAYLSVINPYLQNLIYLILLREIAKEINLAVAHVQLNRMN